MSSLFLKVLHGITVKDLVIKCTNHFVSSVSYFLFSYSQFLPKAEISWYTVIHKFPIFYTQYHLETRHHDQKYSSKIFISFQLICLNSTILFASEFHLRFSGVILLFGTTFSFWSHVNKRLVLEINLISLLLKVGTSLLRKL